MKKGIILFMALAFILSGCSLAGQEGEGDVVKDTLSLDSAKAQAEDFINSNLVDPSSGSEAKVTGVEEENGLYKMNVQVGGQSIDSYMTKDGKTFFPQSMSMEEEEDDSSDNSDTGNNSAREVTVSQKAETPQVELFVMSHCPYGTQMEKAILPVVETLGEEIDFDLKFCDYAMHDKKELQEQMNQYCIQEEHPDKLLTYLDCFLESSDSESCLQEAGIDQAALDSCVDRVDQEYNVMANYEDKSTWKGRFPTFKVHEEDNEKYGISGSPALVVNGEEVQAQRTPNSLLNTICSAFEEKPEECDQELSSSSPSPGFGSGTGGSASNASCE